MDGVCSTNEGEEKYIYITYYWGSPKERDHWEDQNVSG
jgi:hypothetical protein